MWVYGGLFVAFSIWLQSSAALHFLAALSSVDKYLESSTGFDVDGLTAGPVLTFLVFFVAWHGHGALQAFFDNNKGPWTLYKASSKHPDNLSYRDMIGRVLFNQVQLLVAMPVVWSLGGLRSSLPLPTSFELIAHTAANMLCYEVIFYATHRALHLRLLYPYHAMHHDTRGGVGVSGMYQGSLDYFLTTTVAQSVGPVLFGTHACCSWIIALIGGLNSIHSHGGYEWPFSLMPSTREHTLHHFNYKVNFATGPLDQLFGTYQAVAPPAKHTEKKA